MYIQTKLTEKADLYAAAKVTGGILIVLGCVGGALYGSGFLQGINVIPYGVAAAGTLIIFAGNTIGKLIKYRNVEKRKREYLILNLLAAANTPGKLIWVNACIKKDPTLLDDLAKEYSNPVIVSGYEQSNLTLIPGLRDRSRKLQGLSPHGSQRQIHIPAYLVASPPSSLDPLSSEEEL